MNRMLLVIALIATTAYAADGPVAADQPTPLAPLPEGWGLMGAGGPHHLPGKCEVGLETSTSADGPQLFSIRCTEPDTPSFGGAYKVVDSERYQGKRVRVSGWLKVTEVEAVVNPEMRPASSAGGAALMLVVVSQPGGQRRDWMSDRTIKGSTAWEYRDFVVDVPRDSRRFHVGFWMEGRGQVWVRDLQVEPVSRQVPVNFHTDDDPGFGLTLK